ncbi:DAHP synthetase [Fusarium beomiforme]|uniref:Phospho-2-dehydro-3-deoxyheptonate aldolase n=1 Tax=Fusarium beomiforme TaxID=44412 RepID=A0A9P5A855_9HYPO|nr:DAHP synthetase [Fusarium beomiforme]
MHAETVLSSEIQTPEFQLPVGFAAPILTKTSPPTIFKLANKSVEPWRPDSWRSKSAAQAVEYDDPEALRETCTYLAQLPPLVSRSEIEKARVRLYHIAMGRGFIIQGGDCAESFHEVQHDVIHGKVELLYQQCQIFEDIVGKPAIPIGRIAGQYAKPRSNPFEVLPNGEIVHAFKGHNVNSENLQERKPDPKRLLLGYFYASATQNTIRHILSPPGQTLNKCHLYTSHEALHLPYESALTNDSYNLSATTVWLGERTRQLDGAHVEYVRGLRNPIGVKIGPTATVADVVALLNTLSPDTAQCGKVTIITRMGHSKVRKVLPAIIRAVQLSGHVPIWMCDPCHGNTFATSSGIKTRKVDDMLKELQETYIAHKNLGSHLGGIHLEQTGSDVTECLDDVVCKSEEELKGAGVGIGAGLR